MSNKPGKVNCQRRKKNTHSTSDFLLRRMGLDSEMEDLWQQKKKTKVEADEKKKKKTKKKKQCQRRMQTVLPPSRSRSMQNTRKTLDCP